MKQQELEEAKKNFAALQAQLTESKGKLHDDRKDLASRLQAKIEEMDALRTQLTTQCEEKAEKIKRAARKGLEDLGKRYAFLGPSY